MSPLALILLKPPLERLDRLGRDGLPAAASAPLVAERDERPGFVRELVSLRWRAGDPVRVWIVRPTGPSKPRPNFFLYGFPGSLDRWRDDGYCRRVTAKGTAAIGFDLALDGERYRNRPMKEYFLTELAEALAKSVHDVQLVADYLKTRSDLAGESYGIFGQGSAGTVGLLTARVDPRVTAVDVLNPWAAWPEWSAATESLPREERARVMTDDWRKSLRGLDPASGPAPKCAIRVSTVVGQRDRVAPALAKLRANLGRRVAWTDYPDSISHYRAMGEGKAFGWLAAAGRR